ncbi:MAG: serine/threonine-protein kinase [Pseudomonadota bacterium]
MRGRVRPGVVLDGTYRIVRLVGQGGMGEVYEARHARLAGRYAVKVLHPEIRKHPEVLLRFQREAQVTSALRHPGIVQVIDFNTALNGAPYLVMEYLEGEDLGQIIVREGALDVARTVDITRQIASALSAAHRKGIVHRDLKPQNIFLLPADQDEAERAKVLDFGISKIRSVSRKLTATSVVLGTPQFMAPEQAEGREEVDAAADQFSLAAIVYEMLTGRPAFSGDTLASVVYQIVHVDPVPVTRLRPDLPAAIQLVMARAFAKRKQERFASALEFARQLGNAAGASLVPGVVDSRAVAAVPAIVTPPASTDSTRRTETLPLPAIAPSGGVSQDDWLLVHGSGRIDLREIDADDDHDGGSAGAAGAGSGPAVATTTFGRTTGEMFGLRAVMASKRGRLGLGASGVALAALLVALAPARLRPPRPVAPVPGRSGTAPMIQPLAPHAGVGAAATASATVPPQLPPPPPPAPPPARVAAEGVVEFELASEPAGGPVRIDDQPFPTAENQAVTRMRGSLPAGPHTFEIVKEGFAPWRKQIDLQPEGSHRFLARLKKVEDPAAIFADLKPSRESVAADAPPLPAGDGVASTSAASCAMTIGSQPWSDVWVDGKDTRRHTPVLQLAVPCGVRQLRLRRADLGIDFQTTVTLRAGEEFRHVFRIAAMK